ncbi:hypothetical protein B0H17DRAFT_1192934 [Mycena rosella]|uniref:Protein kinase domain-containing protein n=1 Tax=Mycena rosella TaxID=1033263 RepID=A0AAD7GVZ8_MYCRO|nr:hypothetical protein B0H17DRAFT_1192934 [Mycena rosella]
MAQPFLERLSAREDRVSGFFKALCARYLPAPVGGGSEEQPIINEDATAFPPALPVDWTRKELSPQRQKPPKPLPAKFRGDVLQKGIYTPHGKWAWAAGLPFRDSEPNILLSSGVMCSAFLKTGTIGDRPVRYISKVWLTKEKWHGFFSELALYKVQLKALQGRVVPAIINVYSSAGAVDVAMEPPHHSFWIEASPDMPHVLKKRCVQAFEKLHAAGVHHGDIELRHMLIGGDARVTIIDFQASRALVPNATVQLAAATPGELRLEMRKIKFKLDYEGARASEDEKLMRTARLARRNKQPGRLEEPVEEDKLDPPIDSREWNLEWVGAPVEPARFVIPGQSAADVESAVEEFLSILEKLEKEDALQDGAARTPRQRKPSPEFKPPATVPNRTPKIHAPGKGFGATVVHPTTTNRGPRTALKRKSDCDRPQDAKRICIDASRPSTLPLAKAPVIIAPPSTHTSLPPFIVRDETPLSPVWTASTLSDHRQPDDPKSKRVSMLVDEQAITSSPGKRKRASDSEEPPETETRGRPKPRISFSCDVSSPADTCSPPKHFPLTPTPVLFRWIENLWRFVY